MTRRLLVLPLLVLTAACSGGGSGEDDAKAAYVAAAEEVCAQAEEERQAAERPTSPEAIPGYVRRLVTVASDASAELNALEPPEADAAELEEKFLQPLREQVAAGQAYAKRIEETAAGGDTAAVLALLGQAPTQARADLEFLREYGFKACAEAADTTA